MNSFIPFDEHSKEKSSSSRSKSRSSTARSKQSGQVSRKTSSSQSSCILNKNEHFTFSGAAKESLERGPSSKRIPSDGDELMGRMTPVSYKASSSHRYAGSPNAVALQGQTEADSSTAKRNQRCSGKISRTTDNAHEDQDVSRETVGSLRTNRTHHVAGSNAQKIASLETPEMPVQRNHRYQRKTYSPVNYDVEPFPSFDEPSDSKNGTPLSHSNEPINKQENKALDFATRRSARINRIARYSMDHRTQARERGADQHRFSSADRSFNTAHEVPAVIQYLVGGAASSLDDTDLEGAHLDVMDSTGSTKDDALESGVPNKICETLNVDTQTTKDGIIGSYMGAPFQESEAVVEEKKGGWREMLYTKRRLRNQHRYVDSDADRCPSDESGRPASASAKESKPNTKDFIDDYPLATVSVPHSGTADSLPHVAMPTDSAIFATVDRLLGGIDWPTENYDQQEEQSRTIPSEIVPQPEASLTVSLSRPSTSFDLQPVAWEMTMMFILKEAVKYISAALQLLPIPYETKYIAPPKSIQLSIEVIGRSGANVDASVFRLPCRAGMAPVEPSFSIANLDELLYPNTREYENTVDITRMVTKFAGAHPYCLPLSVDHIYEELANTRSLEVEDNDQDMVVASLDFSRLLALSTVPRLLRSGEEFDCRDLYEMAWEMTRFLAMVKTWWDTWNNKSWTNKTPREDN